MTTYISAPIAPPEMFPVVHEEQPVRERTIPSFDLDLETKVEPTPSAPAAAARVIQHPREIRYYSFDPAYRLKPEPTILPELTSEIGKSSILALPLSEYEKMSMTGKTKAPFAPFEFIGVPKFSEARLPVMNAADQIDLKELEADDDIDGIDVTPKVPPITQFLTRPLNTKNKSYALAEAVSEGQSKWRERQRRGVDAVIDTMKGLNELMRDKSLSLPITDLIAYTNQ
jgi:hypothetical protein